MHHALRLASFISMLAIGILIFSGCPQGTPPTAAFTGTPTSGTAPLAVQFTDMSLPGSATITSWAWTFGDGSTSTTQSPAHTYNTAGSFTVGLTVTTSAGLSTRTEQNYILVEAAPEVATYTPGDEVIVSTETVDNAGATLTGTAGSPIEGVSVTFPPGALGEAVSVSLGYETGELDATQGAEGGTTLVLNTPGIDEFQQPVEVTFDYGHAKQFDLMPIPYYVDDDGALHVLTLTDLDQDTGNATFQTFHASWFTWVIETLGLGDNDSSYSTAFASGQDGFQIVNRGSTINRGGECFGMTSFALWYHRHRTPDFYPRFMTTVGSSGLNGQQIIATRSFISIAQQWNTYIPTVTREQNLTEQQQLATITNALRNTGNPVLIYLAQTNGTAAHSILATGYEVKTGVTDVSAYDPNLPNTTQKMMFNTSSNAWNNYNNGNAYDVIVYNGDGSLNLTEPYNYILQDAVANFQGSQNATINITSHTNGDDVPARITTLQGTIESGQVAVTELEVLVNSTPFTTDVPFSGAFSIEIPIEAGENRLQFVTRGEDSSGNKIIVGNNRVTEEFILNGLFDNAAILVTLTWDKNDTDVDLYVIDPTGDYSAYFHKVTADGGELDVDIVTGFGPEHWTLTYQDTVRWDQPYRVRLHYYSDHGNGATNYNVEIKLYEDTDRETATTYRGNLSFDNSGNNQPTGTGADWRDIATVVPTQTKDGIYLDVYPPQPGETFYVDAPVPPADERVKY